MSGLLQASLKKRLKEFCASHKVIDQAFDRLKNKQTKYAQEHEDLMDYYIDLIDATEKSIELAKADGLFDEDE
jgi:hypothetical protein